VFACGSVEAILDALAGGSSGWGETTRAELATKSPTSLKVTHVQLRRGADLDFAGGLRQEFRLVNRFMAGHDFFEGVRALLIDKDRSPRWQPPDLASVGEADVAAYFAPLPGGDLVFDWHEGGEA
jgi:enoyl-CoA hydratase